VPDFLHTNPAKHQQRPLSQLAVALQLVQLIGNGYPKVAALQFASHVESPLQEV